MRRGSTTSVHYSRAVVLLASAGGNRVPVTARLVAADEDTVRDLIDRFNEIGLVCLDPEGVGGRPRLLSAGLGSTADTLADRLGAGTPRTGGAVRFELTVFSPCRCV